MDNKMLIGNNGMHLIKTFEGLYLEAYKCPAGVWTIGYGHTGEVHGQTLGKDTKITKDVARVLLHKDVAKYENYINKVIIRQLTQNQFDALVSFCFNLGYVLDKATLTASIEHPDIGDTPVGITPTTGKVYAFLKEDEDYVDIIPELDYQWLRWCNAGGKPLKGLYRRRKAELKLYKTPDEIGKQIELL
jgi:lysozyme